MIDAISPFTLLIIINIVIGFLFFFVWLAWFGLVWFGIGVFCLFWFWLFFEKESLLRSFRKINRTVMNHEIWFMYVIRALLTSLCMSLIIFHDYQIGTFCSCCWFS